MNSIHGDPYYTFQHPYFFMYLHAHNNVTNLS